MKIKKKKKKIKKKKKEEKCCFQAYANKNNLGRLAKPRNLIRPSALQYLLVLLADSEGPFLDWLQSPVTKLFFL